MRASFRSILLVGTACALVSPALAGQIDQTVSAPKLRVENLIGDLTIIVSPGDTAIKVTATGDEKLTSNITVSQSGDTAVIRMADMNYNSNEIVQPLKMTVTLPPGTDIGIDDLIGDANIGDVKGPLAIDAISGDITIGTVTSASIESSGSADITITEATGSLSIETTGSGEVHVGRAGATAISISGSGDAEIGEVGGSLGIEVYGSANVTVGSVNGPTAISLSGSGDAYIRGGRANPFAAETNGSGDIVFSGTAVNPQVSVSGSGDVCIAAAEGTVQSEGNITIDPRACTRS